MENPFNQCAREYERFRPGYPAALFERMVSHCNLSPASAVLDIGAGTGKGSIPLIERGMRVISADPSLEMIRQGAHALRRLSFVCCSAEEIPFPAGMFDLMTSAQSFHWFDPKRAPAEFARVLKPEGFLALYWNSRDVTHPQARFFDDLIVRYNPTFERDYRSKDWTPVVEATGLFKLAYQERYSFVMPMAVEDWVGLARSISYVRVIGDERMPAFERDLRDGLGQLPAIDCPYVTDVWGFKR